jgi:alkylation response protein AidB-like acyl-CoA dehydrogenase
MEIIITFQDKDMDFLGPSGIENDFARSNDSTGRSEKSSEGLSLFFIDFDKTAPGLELRKIKKMGGRAVDANEVFFDNYRVPADTLIGQEGQGFKIVRGPLGKPELQLITSLGSSRYER